VVSAVRRLTASTAEIGTLLTPVIGVAASTIALGDKLTLTRLRSSGLVVGGPGALCLRTRVKHGHAQAAAERDLGVRGRRTQADPAERAQRRGPQHIAPCRSRCQAVISAPMHAGHRND